MKSKTTKAVANRGVGTDAPRGENKDQKEKRREKTSRCIKIREKMECDIQNLVEGKTFTPKRKKRPFLNQTDLVTQPAPKRRGEG